MSDEFLGETNVAIRLSKVLEEKNIEWAIVTNREEKNFKNRHIPVINHLNPDFIISLNSGNTPVPKFPNYLYLGEKRYFTDESTRLSTFPLYAGFLVIGDKCKELNNYLKSHNHPFPHTHTFFSCPSTPFTPLKYERLFYGGAISDSLRSGKKYQMLYQLLDKTDYLDIYGLSKIWSHLASFKGYLPPDDISLTKAIQKSGVALVLHSNAHLDQNLPSSRLFEAVAASALVISDRLPFAVKNFGNSLLYVDQTLSAEKMFEQVNQHMEWAKNHPEKAQKMALHSHKIFVNNYLLETEVEKIITLYKDSINNSH